MDDPQFDAMAKALGAYTTQEIPAIGDDRFNSLTRSLTTRGHRRSLVAILGATLAPLLAGANAVAHDPLKACKKKSGKQKKQCLRKAKAHNAQHASVTTDTPVTDTPATDIPATDTPPSGLTCATEQKPCNGECIPSTDCCSCSAGAICTEGRCVPCASGDAVCGQSCVNLATDPSNCGRCGNACVSGACFRGACRCLGESDCPAACSCYALGQGGGACAGRMTQRVCFTTACRVGEVCDLFSKTCIDQCLD